MSNNKYQQENYDKNFSLFYNKYLTGQARRYGEFIKEYLKRRDIREGKIIDIMCGTGNLLQTFEEDNWITYGVDISPDMLEIARGNLKHTNLLCQDVTQFRTPEKFSGAVSTADAFNHLESFENVKKTFLNIYSFLEDNGYFIFDMNTPLGIKNNNFYISSSDKDGLSIREGFVDDVHGVGFTRFQGFFKPERDSQYLRFDSTIYNYFYNIQDINESLLKCGFSNVEIRDGYSQKLWSPNFTERVLFICKK